MVKKVVIAAAGRGTRMGEITLDQPKHMIPILGKPFLFYLLKNLKKAGFEKFIVVVGHKSEIVENFLRVYDPNIQTVNQFKILGENEYGTACALKVAEEIVGDEEFVMVNGDSFYSSTNLQKIACQDEFSYLAAVRCKRPERFGVVVQKNGFLEKIIEKPVEPISDLVNCGYYKFTPEVFQEIKHVKKSIRGELELTDVICLLAKKHKVKVEILDDFWLDFGSPRDITKMELFLSDFLVA